MGYMENSYSNSNNGGSVNSQDSLWQMKMAAQANNAANLAASQEHHHHHLSDRNNHYGKAAFISFPFKQDNPNNNCWLVYFLGSTIYIVLDFSVSNSSFS